MTAETGARIITSGVHANDVQRRDVSNCGEDPEERTMSKHGKKRTDDQQPKKGGLMMGMRRGVKRAAGRKDVARKPVKPWMRALDVLLWLAVAAMALYWLLRKG
jgi:hypothetical protein